MTGCKVTLNLVSGFKSAYLAVFMPISATNSALPVHTETN